MEKIKIKPKIPIKKINKSNIINKKLKSNINEIENLNNKNIQEDNSNEFAIEKVEKQIKNISNNTLKNVDRFKKNSIKNIDSNVQELNNNYNFIKNTFQKNKDTLNNKILNSKSKIKQNYLKGKVKKDSLKYNKINKNNNINGFNKKIKTSKKAVKNAEKTTKETIKMSKKVAKITKEATIKSIKITKVAIKATIETVKIIITSSKAFLSLLLAGGWISIIIILLICIIGMFCGSIFGIFFSNENVGSLITLKGFKQPATMSMVISDINKEFTNKITHIQLSNVHNEYKIKSSRTSWKDILVVYTIIINTQNKDADVMILDDNKVNILKEIFWNMNEITYNINSYPDKNDISKIHNELQIYVNGKSAMEMADFYNFDNNQRRQMQELLKDDYSKIWTSVIYGSNGNSDIVEVALSQLGNQGGKPYWSWYGFESRVEWCACFVSYCANECGYIEAGIIPKFAACQNEGVEWFKSCGLWKDGGEIPKTGDIIFFDWKDKHDGHADHVGIVEKVENGKVYTIEGNSNDSCKQRNYDIDSIEIQGYGTPMYE